MSTGLLLLFLPPNHCLARHTESQVVYHVYHAQNVMIARHKPLLLRYDEPASSVHAAAMPAWPTITAQVVYQVQTPNAKVPYSLFICTGLLSFFLLKRRTMHGLPATPALYIMPHYATPYPVYGALQRVTA